MRKKSIWSYPFILIIILLIVLLNSCKKDENNQTILFNPNLSYGTITDQDGNTYKTIKIGTQTWMAENLKTTKYNDGTAIPLVTDSTDWGKLTTPGYCWYDNDIGKYKTAYGALYNWYTVNSGKLCPTGWHVPSNSDWTILENYLGSITVAGGMIKETGTIHWESPNANASNESGFTALPAGNRLPYGMFCFMNTQSFFWSSNDTTCCYGWCKILFHLNGYIGSGAADKDYAYSVRCLKD